MERCAKIFPISRVHGDDRRTIFELNDPPIPQGTVLIGEAGLSGEIRPVGQIDLRLAEIERLGFKRVILSHKSPKVKTKGKLELLLIKNIEECLELFLLSKLP